MYGISAFKQHFEPLFFDTFTPGDLPGADLLNLRYEITIKNHILNHFMKEFHSQDFVYPRIMQAKPHYLKTDSKTWGTVLYMKLSFMQRRRKLNKSKQTIGS